MSGILNKLKDFVGLGEPPQYYDHEYDDEEVGVDTDYPEPYQEAPQNNVEEERSRRRSLKHLVSVSETGEVITKDNVIDMPVSPNRTSEVMVMEPRSFEEMPQAIQALKEQKTLVLNLTMMEPEQAQRAVDFVAGGTYAMDGHQERIGESIFLFTPKSVKVSSQDATLHDVPQVYPRGQRVNSPAPSWSGEARVAQ